MGAPGDRPTRRLSNRVPGHAELPLREPKQREAGLRVLPKLVSPLVRRLGSCEVASAPSDLGELQERGRREPRLHDHQLVARALGLVFGLGPRAAQARDFGSVRPAHPRIGRVRRDSRAPCRRRVAPLAGTSQVADREARGEQVAVDDPREVRSDLAGHDGGHRLVEQREPFRDAAGIDHGEPLRMDRHRDELGVADLAPDPDSVTDPGERALEIAGVQRDGCLEHREKPVFAARRDLGRVPLGAHQEPAPDSGLPPDEVLDREPPGHPARRRVVPLSVVGRVPLFADLERFGEFRAPPGSVCVGLEVGPGHSRAVGVMERGIRGGPLLARRGLACLADRGIWRRSPSPSVRTPA